LQGKRIACRVLESLTLGKAERLPCNGGESLRKRF